MEASSDLSKIQEKLQKYGYHTTIPSGASFVFVIGIGKGYFKAKKAKAESILATLKQQGFNASMTKHYDGYYDFKVHV